MAAVAMRLPVIRKAVAPRGPRGGEKHLVVPGDTITTDTGYMRGHGTYVDEEKLVASVAGAVERVNKLVCVTPLKTRSLKYGKLGQGVLVQVSPSLVKRQKTHFHDLPCGASVILGNNGFIWIYPTPEQKDEEAGGFTTNLEPVPLSDREVISRLRNCVVALVTQKLMLFDTSILYCYEASLPHQIKDILKPEVMEEIVLETRQKLLDLEG
ncbi:hypothetical protein CIB84_007569 [Bambusicola thoracicus]|uniref:EXOS2 protein n=1 Tax=Bambusicola thoracicus TaxID=9083 RepID=A0A2P4SX41_BAMTH|nr:hypothetical protein CIB84_007569 [Bambusicola thoracicus]